MRLREPSLLGRRRFEENIIQGIGAAVCGLRVRDTGLVLEPTEADLDDIDRLGFVRVRLFEFGGSRSGEQGIWGTLWVSQGRSFGNPELSAMARSTVPWNVEFIKQFQVVLEGFQIFLHFAA